MLPCHCYMLHCTPSECWQVRPRWSTPCWCQYAHLWVHPSKQLALQMCHKNYDKQFTCTGWVGCHARRFTKSVPVSRASRKLHTWKLALHIASWFWTGSLRQQKSSASNLAFLSAQVNLYCVGISCVSRSIAIYLNIRFQLVTNYNFFQNTTVILLDFQP